MTNYSLEPSKMIHSCEISDSFVHPNMKLSNGKNGNGESRLFVSCSSEITNNIADKNKLLIHVDPNYLIDVKEFTCDDANFRKYLSNRFKNLTENSRYINGCYIDIEKQNGNEDINRNYIGQYPHRRKKDKTETDKKNIQIWDILRKSVVPTKTTLQFFEEIDYIRVNIVYNQNVHKYNKPSSCSFVQIEFLNTFSKIHNIEIRHSMNGGEHKERKKNGYFWPVDGYHNCSEHKCCGSVDRPCIWNNYVFEFQGTYWHKDKEEKDKEKKEFYEDKGYKWFEITESEWSKRKKLMKNIVNP